jgi:hypothetical protein
MSVPKIFINDIEYALVEKQLVGEYRYRRYCNNDGGQMNPDTYTQYTDQNYCHGLTDGGHCDIDTKFTRPSRRSPKDLIRINLEQMSDYKIDGCRTYLCNLFFADVPLYNTRVSKSIYGDQTIKHMKIDEDENSPYVSIFVFKVINERGCSDDCTNEYHAYKLLFKSSQSDKLKKISQIQNELDEQIAELKERARQKINNM